MTAERPPPDRGDRRGGWGRGLRRRGPPGTVQERPGADREGLRADRPRWTAPVPLLGRLIRALLQGRRDTAPPKAPAGNPIGRPSQTTRTAHPASMEAVFDAPTRAGALAG